jgi:hypothetical protein
MAETCEKKDFAASTRTFLFFWGIPIAALVLASFLAPPIATLVRASALFWAGAACAVNAYRCGRLHCYVTGPLFLVAGLAILLAGFANVAIPFRWILIAVAAGTCVAFCLEGLFGTKYVHKRRDT